MKLKARNRIVTGALVLLLLLVLVGSLLAGAPLARAAEAFVWEGRNPPAGLAVDADRQRYWALDRSSGNLSLTALGADGTVQGEMTSRDTLVDAVGLTHVAGTASIGDIGGERESVTIYQILEPWPATDILRSVAHELAYPDGEQDGVALLGDAQHRLYLVTGGEDPGVYRAPLLDAQGTPEDAEPAALERIADAPEGVTGGTVLRDGRWALRTETEIIAWDPDTHTELDRVEIDVEERGQVITEGLVDGEVLTGVGPRGVITATRVPGPAPQTPAPRAVRPTSIPVATTDVEADTRTFEQTGTTFALAAAAIVAVLAGLVVLVRR
ncbi:MAG: hypothetical protein Q4F65_02890 [Propionibacteriaceae bacterium]|nr:hypothetical protein [Propionibacteriaceae bacterium]